MTQLRNTPQRSLILKYLRSVKSHPSAEMVYNEVKKEMPSITLATVYRNLNLLAEQNQILKLEINSEFRYDACIKHHQHCICKRCNKIEDLFQEKLSTHALKNIHTKSFIADSVNILFYGICKECQ